MVSYLIIGGSIGALGAVEGIRRLDSHGETVVVSEEQSLYLRPSIGKYLEGKLDEESIAFGSNHLWELNKVQVLRGTRVASLDAERKTVRLEDGRSIAFDRLPLATGSSPIVPKIEGIEKAGVHTFGGLSDIQAIRGELPRARSAVIIGGGLIGVAATETLMNRGKQVTVVELRSWLLILLLSQEAAAVLERAMRRCGIDILNGLSMKKIERKRDRPLELGGVLLSDQRRIDANIVVAAIGVTQRIELARQAGLKKNRGILVDRFLETSIPGIFACGDVAETPSFFDARNQVVALWPFARLSGRVVESNMAGGKMEYSRSLPMSAVHYFNLPIISAGYSVQTAPEGSEKLCSSSANAHLEVLLLSDRLIGFTLVGDGEPAGLFLNLLRSRIQISDIKDSLLDSGFSFAHLPESLRKRTVMEVWA